MEGRKMHANISSFEAESMSHNVHDLLVEILLRLPSKSLMRFKSVCKSWRALIISKYFCLLWQQHHHQGPGILLMSQITEAQPRYIPLSGPTAGKPRFEIPRDLYDHVLQSCNGFLLLAKYDVDARIHNFWVYNPATMEVAVFRPPRMSDCKIHARRRCTCVMQGPVMAFDSHSNGRVIAIANHLSRRKDRYFYQVCVSENLGAWRSSSKPFRLQPLSRGVHWHNFVVWVNPDKTLLYDVRGEVLRFCDPPDCSMSDYFYRIERSRCYHLGASGGHLHFIHNQGNRLIIKEMKHDLSGWFLKHNIELSQIEESLFRSIGWDVVNADIKFEINFLIEEKEDSKLVLGCRNDVVLYRIQDDKSWKLCEWEFMARDHYSMFSSLKYFRKFVYQHVETISRFHDQC